MKKICLLSFAMTLLTANIAFAADEIHWTVTGQDSVTFDWRGTATENTIGYGLTSGAYTQITATTPNPKPVSSSGPFWEAKLTGLAANTRYYYKIGTLPERSFRTPPAPGSSGFNVYTQGNIGSSSTYFNTGVVQGMMANNLPSFVVGLGDLTLGSKNGKASVDQHFNDVMAWSKEAAYMPVWGDMEAISTATKNSTDYFSNYKGRFAVPNPQTSPGSPLAGGEDWYWFDYGNVRFITMSEPWTGAWADWNTKAKTLMAQAQADANIKFIVTFVHQPAYSSGHYTGSSTLKGILDALGDTYSKYKLNINAHSNNYERSLPQHGVIHVTAGTGGANLTNDGTCLWLTCAKPVWSAFRAMHLGALQLHFSDSGIEGSFICGPAGGGTNDVTCTQGSIIDSFTIGNPYNFPPTTCAPAPASSLVVNVKNYGAKGDGVTNDTAAIQAAINQAGGTGGTVLVPDGTYMINATTSGGIKLNNNMTLRMASGAILSAIPNNLDNFSVLMLDMVSNVNVIGGTIQGDRAGHTGTTGEWGHGVRFYASNNVIIEGVTSKDNWGDGFYVGNNSNNSTFCSVVSDNNRRQGMSITEVDGVIVKNSIFKNTHGTAPMAGIDVEPGVGGNANNVQILNNEMMGNYYAGITANRTAPATQTITNLTISGNNIHDNAILGGSGYGIVLSNIIGATISGNNVQDNVQTGIALTNFATGNTLVNNTIVNNGLVGDWSAGGILFYNGATTNALTGSTITGNKPVNIRDSVGGNTIN